MYALCQYEYRTDPRPGYHYPAGVRCGVDLRPLDRQASPNLAGWMFAQCDALPSGAIALGSELNETLTESQKRLWESAAKVSGRLQGTTPAQCLWEMLTTKATPETALGFGPSFRLELWCGGLVKAAQCSEATPEWSICLARLKRTYKQIRDEVKRGLLSEDMHLKWLGFQERKLKGIPYRLIQGSLPDEKPRKPATTLTDDFSGDGNLSGRTASGGGTWSEPTGTGWETRLDNANVRLVSSGDHIARLDSDLSGDDHECYCTLTQLDNHIGIGSTSIACGPTARHSAAADTFYTTNYNKRTSANNAVQDSWKVVAGAWTEIGSASTTAYSIPEEIKISVGEGADSNVKRYLAGSLQNTATDTAITGNLRCGLYGFSNNASRQLFVDDWFAADIAGVSARNLLLLGVGT